MYEMHQKCCCSRVAFGLVGMVSLSCLGHGAGREAAPQNHAPAAPALPDAAAVAPGRPARAPAAVRVEASTGAHGDKVAGLVALEDELHRAMAELGKQSPPPYYIGYEVHDRHEISVAASDGALTSSDDHRTRMLSTDVRVGDHQRDSTHAMRGFFGFGGLGGAAMLPIEDQALPIRAVAWAETDRRYKAAVERLLKINSESKLKTAEEAPAARAAPLADRPGGQQREPLDHQLGGDQHPNRAQLPAPVHRGQRPCRGRNGVMSKPSTVSQGR